MIYFGDSDFINNTISNCEYAFEAEIERDFNGSIHITNNLMQDVLAKVNLIFTRLTTHLNDAVMLSR